MSIRQELDGINFHNFAVSRITGANVTSTPLGEQDLASSSYDGITELNDQANLIFAENAYRRQLSGSRTTG